MRKLANIIWHIPFLGFVNAFFAFVFGLGLIELSKFLLTPFSSEMVDKKNLKMEQNKLWKSYGLIVRVIYFPFGLGLAIVTMFQIVFLFFTIIGIPVAVILSKSLGTFFNPVNKKSVPRTVVK